MLAGERPRRQERPGPARRRTSRTPSGWPSWPSGACCGRAVLPPPWQRKLRDLTRYRRTLTHERTREKQRAEKLLEDAQIKLSVVISDIFGVSGRRCWRR